MPRFFLNVRDGDRLIEDRQGLEMPSAAAACEAFRRSAQEILDEDEWRNEISDDGEFQIVDELGRTIGVILFSDIVDRR